MASTSTTPDISTLLEDHRIEIISWKLVLYWSICAGILFWEYLATFKDELDVIWTRARWSWLKILYVANRYFAIIYMIIQLLGVSMAWRPDQCWHLYKFMIFGLLTIMTLCETILIARVGALYENSKRVLIPFGIYMVIQTAYCATLCGLTEPVMVVGSDGTGACAFARPFSWFFTCFVWHAVFDTAVIILTIRKTRQLHRRAPTPIVERIHADGLLYYVALVSVNIFNIIPMAIPGVRDQPMINVPLSAIVTTMMCTRLVLRLRQSANGGSFPSLSFSEKPVFVPGLRNTRRLTLDKNGGVGSGSSGSSNEHHSVKHVVTNLAPRTWRSPSNPPLPVHPTAVSFATTDSEWEAEKGLSPNVGVIVQTESQVVIDMRTHEDDAAFAAAQKRVSGQQTRSVHDDQDHQRSMSTRFANEFDYGPDQENVV